MEKEVEGKILEAQKIEITEHYIYKKLADSIGSNKKILNHIAQDELKHYNIWKKYTKKEIKPNRLLILKYYLISKIFGLTFGLKLMEKSEERAQINYKEISKKIPEAEKIRKEESEHEKRLIDLLDEEKLNYVGSIVLGLNDALVELTGTLAGLTLALQNSKLIAIAGLVTGIAASLSMAASEYLSTKSENSREQKKNPIKAALYTGVAYILTVLFLIFPYLIINNLYLSLAWTLINAIIVIFIFTYYVSVAKDMNFKKEFYTMALISLSIAAISFVIGYLIRVLFGIY